MKVNDYSKIVLTATEDGPDIPENKKVTYTAKVYDNTVALANPKAVLHWKMTYIPVGQDNNTQNWSLLELQGGGPTQTITWIFLQGGFSLSPGDAPYKLCAWIEATEYCTFTSGATHINVVRNK